MSNREAGISILKTQRSYLKTYGRSIDNMINETPKDDARHWELIRERESLRKEMSRITHRLKRAV
jgi:hypothetical protein